jgi:hypothetical protein
LKINRNFKKRFRKGMNEQEDLKLTHELKLIGKRMGHLLSHISIRRETGSLWWYGSPIVVLPKLLTFWKDLEPATKEIEEMLDNAFRTAKKELWQDYMHRYHRWKVNVKNLLPPSMMSDAKKRISAYRPIAAIPHFEELGRLQLVKSEYHQSENLDYSKTKRLKQRSKRG